MPRAISNDSTGRFLVTTATGSHYVVNLDDRTVSRKMVATAPLVDFLDAGFSQLRRDEEALQLLMPCSPHRTARLACPLRVSRKVSWTRVRSSCHELLIARKAGPARLTVQGPL
jgi:hypothetical protein